MAPPGTMLESGDQEMARSSIGLTEKVCPTPPGSVINVPTILTHFCGITGRTNIIFVLFTLVWIVGG